MRQALFLIWMELTTSRHEASTAATDLLLTLCACIFCYGLFKSYCFDYKKRNYWVRVFAFTGVAAFLGALDHGLVLESHLHQVLEQFTHLCLGFVIAYFVQSTVHERWGEVVSDRVHPYILVMAMAYYVAMVVLQGSFSLFIVYQAIGMLYALFVFNNLYFSTYQKRYGLILLGILVSFAAAWIQGTQAILFDFIWSFDHNGVFHLLQAISGLLIFLGVRYSIRTNEEGVPPLEDEVHASVEASASDHEPNNLSAFLPSSDQGFQVAPAMTLSEFSILNDLSGKQLKRIKKIATKETYSPDTVMIEDGTRAKCFYLILKGSVIVQKGGVQLAEKYASEHLGLMPILDGSMRSANVVSKEKTTVLKVSYKKIKAPENLDLYTQIMNNQLIDQQNKLRRMNEVTIVEVKEKLHQSLLKEEFSGFFISLVFGLVLYQFLLGCFLEWTDVMKSSNILEIFTPLFTIAIGIMSFAYAWKSMYPLKEFGLHLNNWKSDVIEALKWTAWFIAGLLLLKWMASYIPGSPFYGRPVIDPISMDKYGSPSLTVMIFLFYALLVPVQELVARAVIQSSLMRVFSGKWGVLNAILLSNLMFSAFHLYLEMSFAIMTFIPGIFWGYLFAKQKGMVGVSVSHIIIGIFALVFLSIH